jgi:hypothetical protein
MQAHIPGGEQSREHDAQPFLGNPWQGARFTHFVEIDVTGLDVVQGRPGVSWFQTIFRWT